MVKIVSAPEWEEWLGGFPEAHILQTAAWGNLKSSFGWRPVYLAGDHCGALVLFKQLPLGFTIGYLPKGPAGDRWEELWPALDDLCRQEKSIFLRIEPDLMEAACGQDYEALAAFADHEAAAVQPRRSITISLEGDEQDWLARMKPKTRYNIRLAEKKDVRVGISSDVDAFTRLMDVTGERDGFGVHTPGYYRLAYQLFSPGEACALLIAHYEDKPLAGVMVFRRGSRAWFLFGGSSNEERNRMPAYLVQWQAMRWAAEKGCKEYDLWGAPDYDEDALEAGFQSRSDGLWGVYRFKRGFGGTLRRSCAARDRVYQHSIYRIYQWYLKRRQSTMQ